MAINIVGAKGKPVLETDPIAGEPVDYEADERLATDDRLAIAAPKPAS